jgi:Tfp pilus assembly protein PilF
LSTQIHNHLHRAEEFLQAKDSDAATKEFNAVLALDPKNAEAHANLGVIAFFRQDYQGAAQSFRKALATQPSLTKTQALLGICEKRLGEKSARASLEQAFPKLKDKQLKLQTGLELAQLYEEAGDTGATAIVMKTLVDLDPDNVDVLFMAQRVYSELADDTLNKLALLAPSSARMQQVIAERLVNEGDLKNAIEHYKQALQLDPRLPGVHFELGEAILQSAPGDATSEADAKTQFDAAVSVDGDTAKTECEFGSIALLQSQPDQAAAHYKKAFQLDPNEVQAQLGLAKLALNENPQEAVKYLKMAVQSDPLNGSAHYQLAQAYRRLQMVDMARKEAKLFEEIKKAKDQVQALYHQMNRQVKPESALPDKDEVTDHAQ